MTATPAKARCPHPPTAVRTRRPTGSGSRRHQSLDASLALLATPFDAFRHQYAHAVNAGMLPRSTLASGRLERLLNTLENLLLGPLARHR